MITSLSEDVGRTTRRQQITPLDVAYHQLNEFIDKINDKINNRLQLVQQVYVEDYKDQTSLMKEELDRLRAILDLELVQQRSNEKMLLLEEERDFFRAQVLKLNTEVNHYVEQNKELKRKIADIEVETANYKAISINHEKRIMKLQKQLTQMANFKRQSSSPTLPQFKTQENSTIKEKEKDDDENSDAHQQTIASHVNFIERRPALTVRTKSLSKHESATKATIRRYEQSNGRQFIIDECIKQIKKQIFYRTHDQKGFKDLPFDQFGKVQFERFTRTDKKQLIQSLLSNDKLLQQFNEFLFNKNSQNTQTTASRMLKTKVGDDKFNQKFLTDLKRSFSKKIYDLKTNPDTAALSRAAIKKRVDYE